MRVAIRSRKGARTRRRWGARAFLALTATIALPACSHAPGVSNGSVEVCYRAIPVARSALGGTSAQLVGVHRVALDQVRDRLPVSAQSELAAENDTTVCALAWKGRFASGQVQMAPTDQTGPYAIVLVSSHRLHLVGAVVLQQLPKAFGGRRFL